MKRFSSGMTLIEILVAATIMTIFGIAIYFYMSNLQRTYAIAQFRGNLRQEAQIAIRALSQDISSARVIIAENTDDDGEQYKMDMDMTETNEGKSGSLDLKIPKVKESYEITLFDHRDEDDEEDYDTVNYTWGNGILTRKLENGPSSELTEYLESFKKIIDEEGEENKEAISYDGKIGFTLKMAGKAKGYNEEITHQEDLVIAIRQLQKRLYQGRDSRKNKHWRQKFHE